MSFFKYLFRSRRDRELNDEIDGHFQMALRDRLDRGEPYSDALDAVRREFGGEVAVKEVTREMWGWTWLETLFADTRYALRVLRKNPGWAAAVALSLALGVGANTAIFSLTYAVLLKSLPVPNPGQLIRYTFRNGGQEIGISGPAYDSMRRHQTIATDLLAWGEAQVAVDEHGELQRVNAGLLSGNGFPTLQLKPALGSTFSDSDDVPEGGARGYQCLITDSWWRTHFHQDPSVIGRSLTINNRAVNIAGVLPAGFEGLVADTRISILLPLAFEAVVHAPQPIRHHRGSMWLTIMGRLKRGESVASAQANMRAIEKAVREEADPQHVYLAGFFKPFHFGVESGRGGRSYLKMLYERPLLILEMLVALLLLLCCASTALLVLAHVSSRAREFALRSALGARRLRVLRQVLLEILILAIPGLILATALGWELAGSLTRMLGALGPGPTVEVTPNAAILGFTAGLTILAALSTGLLSAIRSTRVDPAAKLMQGGRSRASGRSTGAWIIPAQVAVSVTLIASALLLGSSFLRLYSQDSGFDSSHLLLSDLDLRAAKFKDAQTEQAARQIVDRLASTPGIESATFMSIPPLHDWWSAGQYASVDRHGTVHSDMTTWEELVSPAYFKTMGTRLLRGAAFTPSTQASDRTCVLSESAAAYFFPDSDAIGQLLYSNGGGPNIDAKQLKPEDACRVIGVAANAHFRSLREAPTRMLYKLFGPGDVSAMFTVAVRTHSDAQASTALRDVVHRMAPSVPAPTLLRFNDVVDAHLTKERMLIRLSVCFGICALLLTGIGLYGLLMRNVTQRTQEIGIRMALGARPWTVVGTLLRTTAWQMLVGLAAGTAMALAAGRAMASLLFATSPQDPWIYLGAALVLIATGFLATLLPARRAAKLEPMEALRIE